MTKTEPRSTAPPEDAVHLAATLAPVLADACAGRLSSITWFRSDWQHGGAATGTARYEPPEGDTVDVVVKLPVVQRELLWMRRLQSPHDETNGQPPVVPRLYASGQTLGEYDLSWMVIERFEFGPLGVRWHEDHIPRMAEAAGEFYRCTLAWPVDQPAREEPWETLLKEATESLKTNPLPRSKAWRDAVKRLRNRLGPVVECWKSRDTSQWLHGDLHLANAMSRESLESGPVSLIDLAEVRAGHWVEDAVYLERQLWARPERLKKHAPVKAIAAARRSRSLSVDDEYPRLAMVRRALLAATAPRFLRTEGNPTYLEACLDRLTQALAGLKSL